MYFKNIYFPDIRFNIRKTYIMLNAHFTYKKTKENE